MPRWESTKPWDLVAILAASAILLAVIGAFPESPLRIVLGLPFILFMPGYALVAALFPERHREPAAKGGDDDGGTDAPPAEPPEPGRKVPLSERGLDPLERVALSFGLSIAVVPLLGLGLNSTPWGIRLTPILVGVTGFISAAVAAALWRRRATPEDERFRLLIEWNPPETPSTRLDKALTVLLVVAVVAASGTLVWALASPREPERFTEFYILGPEGKAEDYPTNLSVGEEGEVIIGIVNHEGRPMTYYLEVWGALSNDDVVQKVLLLNSTTLPPLPNFPVQIEAPEHNKQFETAYNISLSESGSWQIHFLIFPQGATAPASPSQEGALPVGQDLEIRKETAHRRVHLWVTVR